MQRLADPLAQMGQHFQSGPSRLALNLVEVCIENIQINGAKAKCAQTRVYSPRGRTRRLDGGMKQDVQPGSDSVSSRRAGMSPSSSLMFVLHIHGVITEGAIRTQVHDG